MMKYNIMEHSSTLSLIFIVPIILLIIGTDITKLIEHQTYDEELFNSILQATVTLFSIIIALSILSLEHSVSNHTALILTAYMKDKFVISILLYNILFIMSILFTIYNNWEYSFLILTLFIWNIITLTIYLFYMLYLLNPIFVAKKIKSNMIMELKNMKKSNNQIANMNIDDEKLTKIKKYESALENIIHNSYIKRDHEVIGISFEVYYRIIIIIMDDQLKEDLPESFITYIILKIAQHGEYNIKNHDLVSFNQIIEIHKKIAKFLINKKYNNLDASPLMGILSSMAHLATMCIKDKEGFPVYKILTDLANIGESSKNNNIQKTIDIIFHIVEFVDDDDAQPYLHHSVIYILRVLVIMTTIRISDLEQNFEHLNNLIQRMSIIKKNKLFSLLYSNNNVLLLHYVNDTIQAEKTQKIPLHVARSNLLFFLKFIKNTQPSHYDKLTINIIHNFMVKIKFLFDNESLEKFSDICSIIDSEINSIIEIKRKCESTDDEI